ncbi:hypothetical protein B566_EDAN010756 [Ephemera danica]|nr:hypothetical protein B566_EDAN010756 [Ephemera danica]
MDGAAAVELIKQVLEAPGVYVFGELMEMPNIAECIPYSLLLQELDIKNVRDLEDLIIEAIYSDIIHGKLDQKNSQLEVDYAIGRDIRLEEIGTIVATLQEWCDSCETVLGCVETQILRANTERSRRLKHKEGIEQEVANIKKTLKTQTQDNDEAMATDSQGGSSSQSEKGKKPSKTRGLRGSGKFWQK